MKHRAVVTGLGVISPSGCDVKTFWDGLLEGKSCIDKITRFDVSDYSTKIAAELKDFDGSMYIEKKELRRLDLSEQYALAASIQAYENAGLDSDSLDLDRCGVVIGSGIGGIGTFEKQHSLIENSGPGRVSPFFIPMMIIDMCAGIVSMRFGFKGPNYATVSACASSSHAILNSMYLIQRGDADVMVCGGTEAPISPSALAGFCKAKAMSTRNDEPEKASRPFDVDRDGFVMGEGSAILILENYEHAKARGAKIYGEICGGGMSADAYHVTAPHPEGHGAKLSMKNALKDANISPDKIEYINTHGTATNLGDIAETKAIKEIFGDHAYKMVINSTKSILGHLLGAAGAIESIVTIKSIEDSVVHPTINLDNPDPECDLDYVPNVKKNHNINYALTNSFGFGGHNVSLLIGKSNDSM